MTALPATLADLEARMRAQSEVIDKSMERKAKGPEFINFTKPGKYVIRVLPSRNYPNDLMWFRKTGRHFIKPEGSTGFLFNCDYHTSETPCAICKAVKTALDGPDGIQKDVANGKFGKGSAKSSGKYLINVVTPDKQDVVQTAEVPQTFVKFLRTFQSMVNMLFCDPQHGNLIAFEAFPAANGFGNDYKILKQQPMPTAFTAEQIPDLDEVLKLAVEDVKPVSAFTGNLAVPLAPTGPAPGAPGGFASPAGFATPAPAPAPAADAFGGFGGFAAPAPTPAPAVSNDTPPWIAPAAPAADAFAGFAATTTAAQAQVAAAPAADPFASFASSVPAQPAPAAPVTIDATPVAAPVAQPAAPAAVGGISDADAAALQARLLAMVGQG